MSDLTKEQIRERLKTVNVYIGTTRTALFAAVAERKMRYIVYIWLFGDRVASRTVDIEKLEEDETTYTPIFDSINVAPPEKVMLPPKHDIENPIETLEGGTRLYGRISDAAGVSLTATICYYDNDI